MLTATGLINSTKTVAGLIRAVGTIVLVAAAFFSIYYSLYPPHAEEDL